MKKLWYYVVPAFCVLALSACSSDDDDLTGRDEGLTRLATVTLMATPNGLGDNGYNDAAAEGIFAFSSETGTWLRLLLPKDEAEAEQMYRQWLTDNAEQDSAVLILGSSAYTQIAKKISTLNSQLSTQKGSRVLLFESDAEIDGVSTVMVSHYGVSWLAGAMSQGFDALILAASEGIPSLEESIDGYQDARKAYAGEFEERPCRTTTHYLTNSEAGFAMPDSAYRYIARRSDKVCWSSDGLSVKSLQDQPMGRATELWVRGSNFFKAPDDSTIVNAFETVDATVQPYTVRGYVGNYPVVRIFNQIWMRKNYEEKGTSDGVEFDFPTGIFTGEPGEIQPPFDNDGDIYYSFNQVRSNNFLPIGWRVTSKYDFINIQNTLAANSVTHVNTGQAFAPEGRLNTSLGFGMLGFWNNSRGYWSSDLRERDQAGYYGCLTNDSKKNYESVCVIDQFGETFNPGSQMNWDDNNRYTIRLVQDIY